MTQKKCNAFSAILPKKRLFFRISDPFSTYLKALYRNARQ